MTSRKPTIPSLAEVRRQWKLLIAIGEVPVSVKFHPDGTFRIMTQKHAEIREKAIGALDANSWDEVLTDGKA